MRKNLNVSTDALGKMLAEYLVIQGWAEENQDGSITLNQTGIEKLAGPPYFFYLRDEDSPDEVNQVEVASNAATFTWYQKNFSPGKFRQRNDDRQQQVQPDLNDWKPGLISNSSDQPRQQSTFIPRQQYQHQGGQGYQGKKFYPKNQGNSQHAGGGGKKFYPKNQQQGQHFSKNSGGGSPIKLSHNVPQIAKPQHFKNNKFKK
jgi:hypothetical protein